MGKGHVLETHTEGTTVRQVRMKTYTASRVVGENAKHHNNEIFQTHYISKNYNIPNDSRM